MLRCLRIISKKKYHKQFKESPDQAVFFGRSEEILFRGSHKKKYRNLQLFSDQIQKKENIRKNSSQNE